MAIGMIAEEIKQEMMEAVTLRREWEMLEQERHDLLLALEESVATESDFVIAEEVARECEALRRALTKRQLRNWARINRVPMTPLQKRVLGMRFVRGCPWGDIIREQKKAKQYLIREHNKALNKVAEPEMQALQKNGKSDLKVTG